MQEIYIIFNIFFLTHLIKIKNLFDLCKILTVFGIFNVSETKVCDVEFGDFSFQDDIFSFNNLVHNTY